jgi:hypothetical protein
VADSLDGWAGLVIALGGLAAGATQLVLFWSRPERGKDDK